MGAYVAKRFPSMASSLSADCTPLKLKYDACFNAWFEGYLEPSIYDATTVEQRQERSAQKAREYEERCGKVWQSYRACVQVRLMIYSIDFKY